MLTLNIERRRHILGFEAEVAAHQVRREWAGEFIIAMKYFCIRLASGCLRPAETGAKIRTTGGWSATGRRRAEETKPNRYTPQSRASLEQ